ncbi:RNA polymerase sigma factor [Parafilimonas terrae]|uniref:RNA polymerase sigma factor, sigma-70 family n=1 Tax=Parafilimonas terrae TaxID=1465490 RepID=A0A1I5YX36_9BACT|nr:sigma-70 family RNA polymerase sigma factor [Parafilimonas terrae]SFQ48789.1 RNA polymerase sigma factor, sigma-70 family [Parafilimonas terrae]
MKGDSNEQLLLKALANNDSKAAETIYKDNFNMVLAFIINNNGTYDEARDIFQEAMITLYQKAKSESFVLTSQLKTYIYSVSRRLWLKRLQQLGKTTNGVENFDSVAVDEDIEIHERRDAELGIMHRALNSLGEPCKSLLEAFYIERKSMDEIALLFGYTNADNAKNQKYKCLMRLKKLFFSQYNIGE